MRIVHVFREGKWVPKDNNERIKSLHYVAGDEIEPTQNPADGNVYTSKSKFEAATRAAGCVWVGSEPVENLMKRPKIDHGNPCKDIREAMEKLAQKSGDIHDKRERERAKLGDIANVFGDY